jgi:hypothetical protein
MLRAIPLVALALGELVKVSLRTVPCLTDDGLAAVDLAEAVLAAVVLTEAFLTEAFLTEAFLTAGTP